jgi:NAD dependent epimerase/dehydratase family enzyme
LPVPGFALSLALGEFARTSILGGRRAVPEKLLASGYTFVHPDLESALRAALQRG